MVTGIYKILSILAFAVLYLFTAIIVVIIIVLSWLNAKAVIRFTTSLWAKTVFLIILKNLRIKGRENIDRNERYILIANHASLFDIVAIMSFYPEVSWFGHERLLKIPVFGGLLKKNDYVPFKEPTIKNTRHMLEQLIQKANDKTVAIFPEGTRTLNGEINPFFKGFIYLFRTREIGILPVTLNGFYNLKPKNRFYINFNSELEVIIHKPITKDELINKSDIEIIDTVKKVIESAYLRKEESLNQTNQVCKMTNGFSL
jgi:1-acyl-sn-glycerol-3-phosphate acyltransferase